MSFKPDIDPLHGKIDPPIDLKGAPEFLASDKAGRIYVNLMDKNEVAVVNLAARKVIARWPVAPGGAPVGMAIDAEKGRLFIGCRKPQKLIVMSTKDGKVLADLPIGEGVDAVKADHGLIFASCRDGKLFAVSEKSPGNFVLTQVIQTPPGARTMGMDSLKRAIYLPTAEFENAPAGARPVMKPDTFMIVVVSDHSGK